MEPENRLFQEVGSRLTDALTSLLMIRSLQESEQRLEEAQCIAHVGYWERDLDSGDTKISAEACRIFGLRLDEGRISLQCTSPGTAHLPNIRRRPACGPLALYSSLDGVASKRESGGRQASG
jgi:hypothetical protein